MKYLLISIPVIFWAHYFIMHWFAVVTTPSTMGWGLVGTVITLITSAAIIELEGEK